MDNVKEARPTKFLGVPRVWEKIKDKMEEAGSQSGIIKRAIVRWAKNAALHRQNLILAGKITHQDKGSLNYRLAHKLVLRLVILSPLYKIIQGAFIQTKIILENMFSFSKVYQALGLENTLLSHTSRTCGSAPTSQATKEYFNSLGLFLADLYGSTEATGPQTTILETRKFSQTRCNK